MGARVRERGDRARVPHDLQRNVLILWLVYSVPLIPVDVLSVLAGLSSMSARKFLTIALTGYIFYTGIVAFLGDYVAEVVGVTEAISAIGLILLVGIIFWLWKSQRDQRASAAKNAQKQEETAGER